MKNHGFSLVELLVAFAVCALLSGAVAGVVPSARAAFDSTPEVLDQQQRERTLADVLGRALRSAALLHAVRDDGSPGVSVPAVELLEPDEDGGRSRAFRVLSAVGNGRGVLALDQAGPASGLQLQPDQQCPAAGELCGFSTGATALIVDASGRFDLFAVAATDATTHVLSPSSGFAAPYPAGSAVFEVASDTYRLEPEADGSRTLVRETAAGATQPMVDNIAELSLEALRLADRLTRVDITVRLGTRSLAPGRQIAARFLRLSVALRNPS
jgi:Tfp pilus assembly protein PilW